MIVIDLEATCCDDGSIPISEQETIEIGAAFVDRDYRVISTFESFVRPVRHPRLTAFCERLTSITQQQVDLAKPFYDVFLAFTEWMGEREQAAVIASWGKFDKHQFERDCDYSKLVFKFEHIDLSRRFTQRYGRRKGHRGAMKIIGIKPEGVHHRGLSDALNVAKMLPFLKD